MQNVIPISGAYIYQPKRYISVMRFVSKTTIRIDKLPTLLDKFVLNFCRILKRYTNYVVVSGYVSILFGRARATEDIDIIIEKMSEEEFYRLYSELTKGGYWCINAKSRRTAYNMLADGLRIRFAKRRSLIPNAELKFAKRELEREVFRDNIKVILDKDEIIIPRIEQQIAYKEVFLGSQKDLEDAEHLRRVFRDKINKGTLAKYRMRFRNEN
jgi:hypothetical protein